MMNESHVADLSMYLTFPSTLGVVSSSDITGYNPSDLSIVKGSNLNKTTAILASCI